MGVVRGGFSLDKDPSHLPFLNFGPRQEYMEDTPTDTASSKGGHHHQSVKKYLELVYVQHPQSSRCHIHERQRLLRRLAKRMQLYTVVTARPTKADS